MKPYIKKFEKQIVELYKSGMSSRSIAMHLNLGRSRVGCCINKQGIARHRLDWQNDKTRKQLASRKTSQTKKGKPQDDARIYDIDKSLFRDLSKPFDAYLLGVIVTDGHVKDRSIRLQVSSIDMEWLQLISKQLNVPLKIDNRGYPYLSINSVEIVQTLRSLGVNLHKTANPQEITIPIAENDFIRGLIDGDGSVYFKGKDTRPVVVFGNTNKQLVELVCSRIKEKGANRHVTLMNDLPSNKTALRPYKLPFFSTGCCGKAARLLLNDLYYDGCFANPRKYKKAFKERKYDNDFN